jgi:nucleoside-diphosphate-sugar epimerase
VDLLVERAEHVRALVRPGDETQRLTAQGVEVCHGNLDVRSSLEEAVRGVERVVHCAARTGSWGPEDEYERVNVIGLRHLVSAAMAAGVQRVIHVSSITVHGLAVGGMADESAPFRVEPDPYSRSKVAGERLLQRLIQDQGAPVTIVRPGLLYGPRDGHSFGRFAALVERGAMLVIGSGNNHVPLIYVTDAARGILLASETDQAIGRTYLLVNDELVTQRAYLNTIASELGVPPPRRHIPYRLALGVGALFETAGHLAHMTQPPPLTRFGLQALGGENRFSIKRARTELGFSPQIRLVEGVRQGIAWYRATHAVAAA